MIITIRRDPLAAAFERQGGKRSRINPGLFYVGEEGGGVIDVYTGAEAVAGYGDEGYRFACWPGCSTSEPLAQRTFNQLRQRLTSVVSEVLSRFKQLVIEVNYYSHKSTEV